MLCSIDFLRKVPGSTSSGAPGKWGRAAAAQGRAQWGQGSSWQGSEGRDSVRAWPMGQGSWGHGSSWLGSGGVGPCTAGPARASFTHPRAPLGPLRGLGAGPGPPTVWGQHSPPPAAPRSPERRGHNPGTGAEQSADAGAWGGVAWVWGPGCPALAWALLCAQKS